MKKKVKKPRFKRYIVAVSECELRRLTLYAKSLGVERPAALHRLVAQALRNAVVDKPAVNVVAPNQLNIFDSMQIDIFNNTHKANNQE